MPKAIPFDFVFDYLPRNVVTKSMFGMHYIYFNKKIMLILRKAVKETDVSGIWIATRREHHESLQKEITAIGKFILDNGETYDSDWQLIREDHDDFEASAIRVCELISHGDKRIGKESKKGAML